ncbi:MAG: glycosyltransferase [Phaeodactylibacter sp.]|uniref:glycosyltransferase n=1 Tax=Phaeodactylibacter sp. TaxID=1940289 RepID=UPI0032F07EE1
MYNSFVTVVCVLEHTHELRLLSDYLRNTYAVVHEHFTDFEFIVVNNNPEASADDTINELPDELKHNVYLLNLSRTTNRNHAILAGLDRSNGDYTVIFDFDFYQKPELILQLFERSREESADIVYMRAKQRQTGAYFRPFYSLFYFILRRYSSLEVDKMAHNTRIISRRALNSLLRLRENLRYMKAIYSIVGYRTSFLETEEPLHGREQESFGERFRTSLIAITSFTTFLRSLLLWIFLFSLVFLIGVIANALKVKFTGVDLFGSAGEPYPGWTFLVILIAIFFATTCLNLYIMSIYLSNIYNEIKQRPLYILESIKRF